MPKIFVPIYFNKTKNNLQNAKIKKYNSKKSGFKCLTMYRQKYWSFNIRFMFKIIKLISGMYSDHFLNLKLFSRLVKKIMGF